MLQGIRECLHTEHKLIEGYKSTTEDRVSQSIEYSQ